MFMHSLKGYFSVYLPSVNQRGKSTLKRAHKQFIISVMSQWAWWCLKSRVSIVCSAICSGADQRKHQSSASLAFRWIHRWLVNSPLKGPVSQKMFPFDDIIMMTVHALFCLLHDTMSPYIAIKIKIFTHQPMCYLLDSHPAEESQ